MSVFEKKDPGKFTVRFNMADPQQKAVIDLLNQQGRYKAQFLTNAVLHYVRRSEAPDIKRAPAIDSGEIERIMRSVLAQQQAQTQEPIQNLQEAEKVAKPWEAGSMPGTGGPSEDADKEAIFKTLDAFRTRK